MELIELKGLLRKAWSRETSSDPEGWTSENPAWGQRAVTTLVVQDFFGGVILRSSLEDVEGFEFMGSHYSNLLPIKEVDLSKEQFPPGTQLRKAEVRTREYLLSNENTRKRYAVLRLAVENLISPNPLFSDHIFQQCFANAQTSDCQKMKFGAVVVHQGVIVANTANRVIEPLRHLCEPECIRFNIQSRTESMVGACCHAEEWALRELRRLKIPTEECFLFEIGVKSDNTLWLDRSYKDFTCLRCSVQLYMAEFGKIFVPVEDQWMGLSPEEALNSSVFYATGKKKL